MLYERTKVADMLATDDKLMQEHGMELLGVVEDLPEWDSVSDVTAGPKCYEVIGVARRRQGQGGASTSFWPRRKLLPRSKLFPGGKGALPAILREVS